MGSLLQVSFSQPMGKPRTGLLTLSFGLACPKTGSCILHGTMTAVSHEECLMNNSIFDALRAELGHADPLCPYVTVERLCLELVLTQSARGNLYRITGVDLTQIDSLDVGIAQTLMSGVGLDSSGRLRTCIWMCSGPAPRSASATVPGKSKTARRTCSSYRPHVCGHAASQYIRSKNERQDENRIKSIPGTATAVHV